MKLRGLSPLLATLSTEQAALVIAATRLRGGSAGPARAAAGFLRQTIATARTAGAHGRILVCAGSAYGSGVVAAACRRAGVNFSITLQSNPKLRAAIASIGEYEWTPVRYPGAFYDRHLGQWMSDAEPDQGRRNCLHRLRDPPPGYRPARRAPGPGTQPSWSPS